MICVPSGESLPRSRVVKQNRLTLAIAGQGFSAETKRGDGSQVLRLLDFAGGVPFQAEQGVVTAHAHAVIGHANEAAPAGLDFNGQARGLGVKRILHQILSTLRWPGALSPVYGNLIGHLLG